MLRALGFFAGAARHHDMGVIRSLAKFAGTTLDHNNEASFFLNLDLSLLAQSGGHWQSPDAIRYLLANPRSRSTAVAYLRRSLSSPRVATYLGLRHYLRYRTPANLPFAWGWKLPTTTFTLPLWLEIFPAAKVIHVCRHGVDVAQSLSVRARQDQLAGQQLHRERRLLYTLWPRRGDLNCYLDCLPLERGFALWEQYVGEARRHVDRLGVQAYELRYEDFLAAPIPALRELASFCGLSPTAQAVEVAAQSARSERAYAYLAQPQLRRFAETVESRLHAFGYAADRAAIAATSVIPDVSLSASS